MLEVKARTLYKLSSHSTTELYTFPGGLFLSKYWSMEVSLNRRGFIMGF